LSARNFRRIRSMIVASCITPEHNCVSEAVKAS
jgi:hypothetical protein